MVERTYHKVLSAVVNKLLHPLFGGLDSTRASQQTAPLGSAHVQETWLIMKKLINNNLI